MFYADPARESVPNALPDAEVFYEDRPDALDHYDGPGWYWWFCYPGCMPESEATGPFESEEMAIKNCRAVYAGDN